MSYVWGILGLSVLVLIHEAGHYFVARAFGMTVVRFSIGFGPTLVKYQPRNSPTTFQIGAIPLLAYVQIAGMNPAEEIDPDDRALFPNQSLYARVLTIFAGSLANYVAASLIVFFVAVTAWPYTPLVAPSAPDSIAAQAGLKRGDVIVRIDGRRTDLFQDVVRFTQPNAGKPLRYEVVRDGKPVTLVITPRYDARTGHGVVGIRALESSVSLPVAEAARMALRLPVDLTLGTVQGIVEMVRQRTTKGLAGPERISKELGESVKDGIVPFIMTAATISVALGAFNLLPFPGLDGGRLVFLGYEVITRRKPNQKIEAIIHAIGILVLLALVVYVSFKGGKPG